MKLKICALYDSKAEVYEKPMFFRSTGEAVRSFETIANDPQSPICMHPADFTLFEIGEWDPTTSNITMYQAKTSLGLAIEFKKETQRPHLVKDQPYQPSHINAQN